MAIKDIFHLLVSISNEYAPSLRRNTLEYVQFGIDSNQTNR